MRVPGQPRGTPSSRSHGDMGLREVKRLLEGHAAGGEAESQPLPVPHPQIGPRPVGRVTGHQNTS